MITFANGKIGQVNPTILPSPFLCEEFIQIIIILNPK